MSQLTSFDNCEPKALSKETTVIVLIASPLLRSQRKTLSNVIVLTASEKIRASKMEVVCLLFTEDNDLALWRFPWQPVRAGTGSRISKSRDRPPWPGEALDDWAHIA